MSQLATLSHDSHDPDTLLTRIAERCKEGWKLVGSLAVCPTQGHGGFYRYTATLVKEDPVTEQPKGVPMLLRGGPHGSRLVYMAPGACVYLQQNEFVTSYPEDGKDVALLSTIRVGENPEVASLKTIIKELLDEEGSEGFSKKLRERANAVFK